MVSMTEGNYPSIIIKYPPLSGALYSLNKQSVFSLFLQNYGHNYVNTVVHLACFISKKNTCLLNIFTMFAFL